MAKNYYETLGLPKTASKEEIKRAYRRLAHQYHPDKNGGDEKKFKEINEAYQVLGDEKKKTQYDQFGSTFNAGGGSSSGWDFSNFSSQGGSFEGVDFGDIFSEFFGGGARSSARQKSRGRDISIDIVISLEEAYTGTERSVTLKKYTQCPTCLGKRNEPGTDLKECAACKGSGHVRHEQRTILGSFARVSECGQCKGRGDIPDKKCKKCKGEGRVQAMETITVKIPPGINSGEAISFQGKGEVSEAGYAGDLYARIHIKEHPQFERKGDDIYFDKEVTVSQATLGAKLSVKTLSGEQEIVIPSGTQPYDVIQLQGKGMPHLHGGGFGDQYVKVVIKTPKKISGTARKLFEALQKEGL